jgi:hypothetical protein
MADLIDRMALDPGKTGRPKLQNHQFNAWLRFYAHGLRTRVEVAAAWDLQGDEATQANLLADEIDNRGGISAKIAYVMRVDAVASLLDSRDPEYVTGTTIDKAKVRADLGI